MHPFLKVAMEYRAVPLASTCSQGCDWVVNMPSPWFLSLGTGWQRTGPLHEGGDRCTVAHFPPSLAAILDKSRSPPTLTTENTSKLRAQCHSEENHRGFSTKLSFPGKVELWVPGKEQRQSKVTANFVTAQPRTEDTEQILGPL